MKESRSYIFEKRTCAAKAPSPRAHAKSDSNSQGDEKKCVLKGSMV